jgi:peptide deformylase
MQLEIAQLGQPVLREVAKEVPLEQLGKQPFQELLSDMMETLKEKKGAGLAGPQVFAGVRVFMAGVIPPAVEGDPPGIEVFINPKLTALTDEITDAWEGCLSFPELLVLVPRFRAVRIDYIDPQGQAHALDLQGFPARIVQHEFDHLEGILTIDRAESPRHIVKASEIDDVLEAMDESEDE